MSLWEKTLRRYPMHLSITPEEKELLPIPLKDEFAIHERGTRYIFTRFREDTVYSSETNSWKYLEDHSTVPLTAFQGWFLNHQFLEEVNLVKGTATYSGKNVQWSEDNFKWKYLNHRTVHFKSPSTSQATSRSATPDDDTTKVEDLLQQSEASITSSLQKLSSRLSTPVTQASPLPQISESIGPVQSQVPTLPVSKGKAKA